MPMPSDDAGHPDRGLQLLVPLLSGVAALVAALVPDQAALAQQLYDAREKTVQQIADLFQRELIVANTMDGLASARARGRVGGRRPKLTRCTPLDGVRTPQQDQDRAPPTEEGLRREALKATDGLLAPWCLS
ncbi:hypothetical protein [Streptomyces sp. NBC_00461]|uniref:hypothetical protein n=1 Tax=Streptomyces sp. NBC_00461 TaxID=2975750 RepID=UPI003FCE84E4